MALPDFLVIGAPKAGSTAVHEALVQHPQLFLSPPKEPKYFLTGGTRPARDRSAARATPTARASGCGSASATRRSSTRARRAHCAARARRSTSGTKPPTCASAQAVPTSSSSRSSATRSIAPTRTGRTCGATAWSPRRTSSPPAGAEPTRIAAGFAPFWRYLELGRYGEQFEHLFRVFPREQVHVLRYKELVDRAGQDASTRSASSSASSPGLVDTIPHSNVRLGRRRRA